jgi:hypothetical protein
MKVDHKNWFNPFSRARQRAEMDNPVCGLRVKELLRLGQSAEWEKSASSMWELVMPLTKKEGTCCRVGLWQRVTIMIYPSLPTLS